MDIGVLRTARNARQTAGSVWYRWLLSRNQAEVVAVGHLRSYLRTSGVGLVDPTSTTRPFDWATRHVNEENDSGEEIFGGRADILGCRPRRVDHVMTKVVFLHLIHTHRLRSPHPLKGAVR
jgi:hypothetical protein